MVSSLLCLVLSACTRHQVEVRSGILEYALKDAKNQQRKLIVFAGNSERLDVEALKGLLEKRPSITNKIFNDYLIYTCDQHYLANHTLDFIAGDDSQLSCFFFDENGVLQAFLAKRNSMAAYADSLTSLIVDFPKNNSNVAEKRDLLLLQQTLLAHDNMDAGTLKTVERLKQYDDKQTAFYRLYLLAKSYSTIAPDSAAKFASEALQMESTELLMLYFPLRNELVYLSGGSFDEGPHIQFEEEAKWVGEMKRGDTINFEYHYLNNGNKPLHILRQEPSCSCTVINYKDTLLQPGGKGILNVTYAAAYKGPFAQILSVKSDATNGEMKLVFKGISN
ncbi:uncharacterized protein DUF1573 [Chitinophaga dinghuensis]|uniref:Uncharacterized protein DUF1573 n=2 Tax=Chitinophaga dinghuensis TaxID=1539050 RepID=A0A327VS25_9BACT|nr:uncharacterized protein DUF1573 [Chitinophaga dinghuensis]